MGVPFLIIIMEILLISYICVEMMDFNRGDVRIRPPHLLAD
jgi:hypothetical protein